jgi:hypothetical protein
LFYLFAVASIILTIRVLFEANLFPRMARWMRADEVRARSYATLIREVPVDAGSLATFSFLSELSRRPGHVFSFHSMLSGEYYPGRPFSLPKECSYAFVDYDDPLAFWDFFSSPRPRQVLNRVLAQGPWNVREACGNIVLYEKDVPGKDLVSQDVAADLAAQAPFLIYEGHLALLRLDKEKIVIDGQEGVRLTFVWRLLSSTDTIYGIKIFVVNDRKKTIWEGAHPIGYSFYPTQDWKEGEVVKETFQFLLPREAKSGSCQISLGLINFRSGEPCLVTGGSQAVSGKDSLFISL